MEVEMFRPSLFAAVLLFVLPCAVACGSQQDSPTAEPNLPNPASVNCEQKGGKVDMRQDSTGGVAGFCVFPDGSECDEWAYFRDECKPGDEKTAPVASSYPAPTRTAAAASPDLAEDGWRVYRNSTLGYTLHYPPDAAVTFADDPEHTLTITGPLTGNDHWPVIYFSYPSNREEYRPPAGVDLEKWLTDHNLLMADSKQGEERKGDVQIAGTTAIHTRFERSPQSYGYDKYFFARSGQLYVLVILHTGDKEDWTLYDHLLASIQFDS
jgi:putative hemolysin